VIPLRCELHRKDRSNGVCFAKIRWDLFRKLLRKFQYAKVYGSQKWSKTWIDFLCVFIDLLYYGDSTRSIRGRSQLQKWQWARSMARSIFFNMLMHYWWVGLVGIQFLFVLRLFSFESGFSFMVLIKLCMLKYRHLKVRVRAPRATVMRTREALTLLPVLPLAVDPIQLLVEMQVLRGQR